MRHAPAVPPGSTTVITSPGALDALRPEWIRLLDRAQGASAFQAPAWLIPWCEVWGRERTRVVAVRDARDVLVALLPAFCLNGRLELAGAGVSDYLAPLIDRTATEFAAAALDAFTGGLTCLFHEMPVGVPWPSESSAQWTWASASICPAIALPAAADEFRAGLPHGLQRNLRRYGDRLRDDAGASFATITDPGELDVVLDALFALHALRWHERGAPGVFVDADVRTFHRTAAPALLRDGLLRLHVLRTAAAMIGVTVRPPPPRPRLELHRRLRSRVEPLQPRHAVDGLFDRAGHRRALHRLRPAARHRSL